jgi:sec-independent protein translocase protein TatA
MLIPHLGLPELLIIMVIIVIVFGVGRLGEVGGALGKGIREFRKASSYDPSEEKKAKEIAGKEDDSNTA